MMKFLRSIYVVLLIAFCGMSASAFSLDAYAPQSVLSQGKWVKISVEETRMYCIPTSVLRSWGFSNPSNVHIYGYGGAMLPDQLSESTYIDDLPEVQSVQTSRGLVFYGIGPRQINMAENGELSHSVNPYSNYGYYYLTEESAPVSSPERGGTALDTSEGCKTSAPWMLVHEQELTSPGNSGRMMLGEDFRTVRTREFTFNLTGRSSSDRTLKMTTSFVAHSTASSSVSHVIDKSVELPYRTSDRINATSTETGNWGSQSLSTKTFDHYGTSVSITISYSATGITKLAALDYIEVTYDRAFSGSREILCNEPRMASEGAGAEGVHVWDVTYPGRYYELNVGSTGAWRNERSGVRRYAIWNESEVGSMPAPRFVGSVSNQNLHGYADTPDMVIVAPDAYMEAARRIADIHHNYPLDSLRVETVSLDMILNEFGSGSFDPGAIRRFFKMLYDRGTAAGRPLKYALMIGKGSCDNRALTAVGRSVRAPMPLWVSENSLNDSQSYSTDDYFGLLSDNDGLRPSREDLDIAVGRIPAQTASEASVAADKIQQYLYSMPSGNWRSNLTILADDENQGDHMKQSERMVSNLESGTIGRRYMVDKIYCDAYTRANSTYPQAREDLFANFNNGVSIFAFVGHGSPTALGSKMIIGPLDFRDRFHIRRLPFFYAATCSFLEWDNDITSHAEVLMFQSDGGFIGCISALRPVYITNNGSLTASFGSVLGRLGADGNPPTIGELYRLTKNGVSNDNNKLRYVLMADPALRLAMPSSEVTLDAINGVAVTSAEPYTVMARQQLVLTGRILNEDGSPMSDFNGTVSAVLYDAEFSTTSNAYGEGEAVTFEEKGGMLFSAVGTAVNGEYTVNVRMPATIADNYRPATLSLFATSSDSDDLRQASGSSRDIYAFGYDDTTPADTDKPIIHSLALNGSAFESGAQVNPDPLLIATISDNSGINISTSGVGQKMTLTIDESQTLSDLATYFTPDAEPTEGAMSGTLCYPLSSLSTGRHTLRLRVWDIDGNFAESSIDCEVVEGLAPEVYEVYTDASPARDQARFYVRHNRPEQVIKVKITVYNLLGAPVWSAESEARSNMGVSEPLTWDLCNSGGQRVGRGIYVYRAEVTCGDSSATTKSKKMAVAGQ